MSRINRNEFHVGGTRLSWLKFIAVLAMTTGVFAWLQQGTQSVCCGDFDGYYHLKWSKLLWAGLRGGHLPSFTWLPLTSLNAQQYADQHFLFHLLLIPFTWLRDSAFGAKVYAVVFATVAVGACVWLMMHYRIRSAVLWTAALLGSSSVFLYRMSMTRAQSLSLIFLITGIFLLFERKYRWLGLAAFLYVWTYNLFVILVLMVILWEAIGWWTESRMDCRSFAWTAAGIIAGFVLNPYFPNDIRLFVQHMVARGFEVRAAQGAGAEWSPLSSWLLLKTSFVAFTAMIAGYTGVGFQAAAGNRSRMRRPLFLLFLATLLLMATARSKRFAEYWPPVAVLFAAFALQGACDKRRQDSTTEDTEGTEGANWITATVTISVVVAAAYQVWFARQMIVGTASPPDQYRAGAEWMVANVPRGEIIFNSAWEDFPKLFYYDDLHKYVTGLDPLYLENGNPELSALYTRIASGDERQAAQAIKSSFGARYVFLSANSIREFRVNSMLSGQFERVYADRECLVLKVRDTD